MWCVKPFSDVRAISDKRRGASRQPENESKCDKSVHLFSPCVSVAPADHGPGDLAP